MPYPEHSQSAIKAVAAHLRSAADEHRRSANAQQVPRDLANRQIEQAQIMEHLARKLDNQED